ncbi:hypothetical protein, partial [Vibrio vulnificus]|uniref:hypothetical protein n=1 Tax=Vibrio vulnificus TaxID=672 RepID=UPI003ED9172F
LIEMNTTHIELPLVQNNVQIIVQLAILSKKSILCYNAALRGECRLNQLSADHFHHKNHRKLKMPRGMNPA